MRSGEYAGVSPEDRQAIGISDSLIRLSVGLESTQDMIEDFEKAFGIEYCILYIEY